MEDQKITIEGQPPAATKYEKVVLDTAKLLFLLQGKYFQIVKTGQKGKGMYWTPVEKDLLDADLEGVSVPPQLKSFGFARNYIKESLTRLQFDPPESFLLEMDKILLYEKEKRRHQFKDITQIIKESIAQYKNLIVWQGDICLLEVDGIVNAANDYMLGCFTPHHLCIDNVIHAYSGPRLRVECRSLMAAQGHAEPTGQCKITSAYHLPSKHVLHTVGPIIDDPNNLRPDLLSSSYISCLNTAKAHNLKSIAFCCISTGVFGYPNAPATKTAITTVFQWLQEESNKGSIDYVIFNVFKDIDATLYQTYFQQEFSAD